MTFSWTDAVAAAEAEEKRKAEDASGPPPGWIPEPSPEQQREANARELTRVRAVDIVAERRLGEAASRAEREFAWMDLSVDWGKPPLSPEIIHRTDGEKMLYPGRSTFLGGSYGSMKSLLVLHGLLQDIREGRRPILLDYENGLDETRARLQQMGATEVEARELRYTYAPGFLPPAFVHRIGAKAAAEGTRLVVIDALTDAAAAIDLDLTGGAVGDVKKFLDAVVDPWTAEGMAVVVLDNAPKGSLYDILGAQAKVALVSGPSFVVVPRVRSRRGTAGHSDIYALKDRSGGVSLTEDFAHAKESPITTQWFGRLVVEPSGAPGRGDGGMDVWIAPGTPLSAGSGGGGSGLGAAMSALTREAEATAKLIRHAMDSAGSREVRSIRVLEGWVDTVLKSEPGVWDEAHTDRHYIGEFLGETTNASFLRAEGLEAEEKRVGSSDRKRYRVWVI